VPASVVLGCGAALPTRAVTNDELATALDAPAGTLAERTGVSRRHYVEEGRGSSDLGRGAAPGALAIAGCEPADVDLIVFATMTPDATAASIPLALYEARRDGRVRDGALVCLAAFGAGSRGHRR
jgi:3-oxoacyl-[acyl-carrier-protein] synthase-3